jgi:hypothetical protein
MPYSLGMLIYRLAPSIERIQRRKFFHVITNLVKKYSAIFYRTLSVSPSWMWRLRTDQAPIFQYFSAYNNGLGDSRRSGVFRRPHVPAQFPGLKHLYFTLPSFKYQPESSINNGISLQGTMEMFPFVNACPPP